MKRVMLLSDRLCDYGIDCDIDQYQISPPEGWARWMLNKIEASDFVLVVCTETYERRFRGKEEAGNGFGVNWEGAIITQELYQAKAKNTNFIPIMFSPKDRAYIPIVLRGATHYEVNTEEGYKALYRHLTNRPLVPKPELGKLRPMPPLERKQESHKMLEKITQPEVKKVRVECGRCGGKGERIDKNNSMFMNTWIECEICEGTGSVEFSLSRGEELERCGVCKGKGERIDRNNSMFVETWIKCKICNGTGWRVVGIRRLQSTITSYKGAL